MRRLTGKPWFGPKAVAGWGWRPVSWEGYLTSVVLVGLILAAISTWHRSLAALLAVVALLLAFAFVASLTGDAPGRPRT